MADVKVRVVWKGTLIKSAMGFCAASRKSSPCWAQLLWLKELESYQTYPPMQAPETYNLGQVIQELKAARHTSPSGD